VLVDACLPAILPKLSPSTENTMSGCVWFLIPLTILAANSLKLSTVIPPPPNIASAFGEFNGIKSSSLPASATFTKVPPGVASAIPPKAAPGTLALILASTSS